MDAVPRFLGVEGYSPAHIETVDDLREVDRGYLRALKGQRLIRSWAMWETGDDEWFRDGPLILEFEERRLELAAFKLHLCLSWSTIELEKPLLWMEGSTFQLVWRKCALDPLNALRDPIDEVLALEYRGAMNGFAFRAASSYVDVFNALDELGLTNRPSTDPDVSRTPF